MIAQISNYIIGAISGCYLAIIALYIWFSRTGVNHNLCDIVRKHNKDEHDNIRKWIEDTEKRINESEKRSEVRHVELKSDMKEIVKNGLEDIKELIESNGHSKPRIRT